MHSNLDMLPHGALDRLGTDPRVEQAVHARRGVGGILRAAVHVLLSARKTCMKTRTCKGSWGSPELCQQLRSARLRGHDAQLARDLLQAELGAGQAEARQAHRPRSDLPLNVQTCGQRRAVQLPHRHAARYLQVLLQAKGHVGSTVAWRPRAQKGPGVSLTVCAPPPEITRYIDSEGASHAPWHEP